MTFRLTETDTGLRMEDDDRDYRFEEMMAEMDADAEERAYGGYGY
jgi:hypothetical protein